MKKNNYDAIKAKLLAEKDNLLKEIKNIPEVDYQGDDVDAIQAKILMELHKQLSMRTHNKIMQIDDALKRLEKQTYGICEDCDEQIAQNRLEFNPYFLTCVSCEEEREHEEELRIKNS